jgi:signal transduction histidine kinase
MEYSRMSNLNIKNESIADSSVNRAESRFNYLYQSPAKLVLIIAFFVFIGEYLTMVILAHFPGISAGTANVLDSVLLLTLLIPAFVLFIFRPLLLQITVRKNAEAELTIERNKLKDSWEQLRNLSAHLQAAREEERTAIAREIHDELGQVLATLQLDISWLVGEFHEDQRLLVEKAEAMSRLIVSTVKTVQEISSKLRPVMLDELGLADAMEWQAKEFQKRSGISCDFAVELASKNIDRGISTALYRIFQETLTNVLRHAGATRVEGSLTEKKERIVLIVRDNGRGITREQINDPLSIGLIGMQERTRMLGGRARIRGVDRKGSAIVVRIPIMRREE